MKGREGTKAGREPGGDTPGQGETCSVREREENDGRNGGTQYGGRQGGKMNEYNAGAKQIQTRSRNTKESHTYVAQKRNFNTGVTRHASLEASTANRACGAEMGDVWSNVITYKYLDTSISSERYRFPATQKRPKKLFLRPQKA